MFFGFVLMWYISVKIMVISVRQQNVIYSQPFLKMRKFLLDMIKYFFMMSNFYLIEVLGEPNSFTIVTSKKILKMSNYVLILSIFFLKMRIRNLQCIIIIRQMKFKTYGIFKSFNLRVFTVPKICSNISNRTKTHHQFEDLASFWNNYRF